MDQVTSRTLDATEANRLAARAIEGLPLAERTISLADVSTVVLEGGEGPPMVLLHGQGGFGAFMGGMAAQLVDRYRVVVPDLPGLGRSKIGNGPLDPTRVIGWLRQLVAETCDQPPILFGASLGGSIAARFAIQHPDELVKLILMDSGSLARVPACALGAARSHQIHESPEPHQRAEDAGGDLLRPTTGSGPDG